MSTVVRWLGCRFQINSNDHGPPHCHVIGHGGRAKIRLQDFEVLESARFTKRDVRRLVEIVKIYQVELLEKWGQYHGEEKKD